MQHNGWKCDQKLDKQRGIVFHVFQKLVGLLQYQSITFIVLLICKSSFLCFCYLTFSLRYQNICMKNGCSFVLSQDATVPALQCPMAPAITAHVMPIRLLTSLHLTISVPTDASVPHPIALAVILQPTWLQIVPLHHPLLRLYHPLLRLHQQRQQLYFQVVNLRNITSLDFVGLELMLD